MRFPFVSLLAFLLVGLAFGVTVDMPAVVGKFKETSDSWDKLHRMTLRPGDLNTSEAWREFLQSRGSAVIDT